jgi:lipopolysaccharide/colanic/teichoic acid biosynthesis glycosyltransferase
MRKSALIAYGEVPTSATESAEPVVPQLSSAMSRIAAGLRNRAPLAFVTVPPLVAFFITALTSDGRNSVALAALFGLVTYSGNVLAMRATQSASFLPLVRVVYKSTGAVLLAVLVALLDAAGDLGGATWGEATVAAVLLTSLAIPLPGPFGWRRGRPLRVAVVGSPQSADSLSKDLAAAGNDGFEVLGHIGGARRGFGDPGVLPLGTLDSLIVSVDEYDIDLLLIGTDAPRMDVFAAVSGSLLGGSMRLMELSAFYEAAFGHVPLNAINDSWFQCLLHPSHQSRSPLSRSLDLAIAALVTVAFAPLVAVFALLIKRDGGPVLYRQTRIGECGRPFMIYKLRTMRPSDGPTPWTTAQDDRVTPIGRFLRRTHLDELPQLFNVFRGEMAIVGPRPEQPEIVASLERIVPYYDRRHYARPGVTGWAQIRCGYAGSNIGSAWKASHDLYYAKHRSFVLDLMILVETLRTLVRDQQYGVEPPGLSFLLPAEHRAADERATV